MKREILFRGKTIDNNWVYGDLIQLVDGSLIYHGEKQKAEEISEENSPIAFGFYKNEISPIFPKTIGQFTGLTDKNGVKIFEGDIIKYERQFPIYNMFEENEYGGLISEVNHKVEYFQHGTSFQLTPIRCCELMNEGIYCNHLMEVVGNVFDNPELI